MTEEVIHFAVQQGDTGIKKTLNQSAPALYVEIKYGNMIQHITVIIRTVSSEKFIRL